ncbi:hypothetical protein DL767_001152 [Monosporascus sp. MG133]|nr:hypothetical protein DL767_001152 [Monosporascus sp. MG133]
MTLTDGPKRIQDAPEPIVIVFTACRLPGHVNIPHKLWELLQSGGTAVANEVPKSGFDFEGHFDSMSRPGTMRALSGMFIEDIDPAALDASFSNLNWAEPTAMDPQQRQLLEVVYECFENGGVPLVPVFSSGLQLIYRTTIFHRAHPCPWPCRSSDRAPATV